MSAAQTQPASTVTETSYSGRLEDLRFIRGDGRYASDPPRDPFLYARFVRSPIAHADIVGVDIASALNAPGVIAVLQASDLAADGIADIPVGIDLRSSGGNAVQSAGRRILARNVVRYVGEPVAMVLAETSVQAADAAELVSIEYRERPAIAAIADARSSAAPLVWPEAPGNVGFHWRGGDKPAVEDAFARARHVSRRTMRISRVVAHPLEVRSAFARIDEDGRLLLRIGHQQPFALRAALASILGIDPSGIRVVVPDVGGSFGLRTGLHSEEVAVLWAARRLGQAVFWLADRSEAFVGDDHSRDVDVTAALALDAEGDFLALDVRFEINAGAYLSGRSAATINNVGGVAGVYNIPAISAEVLGIFSNTSPTGPYRGAGRPEATFAIERIIDIAARETGRDPVALRRRNLIAQQQMPFRTALTFTYDCGDFSGNMDAALALADADGFRQRQAAAAARGKLRGMGIGNLIESAGGPFGRVTRDTAKLSVHPDGSVILDTGALSTGQGVETVFSNLVATRLGIPPDKVVYRSGDTDSLEFGRGNGGSGASGVSSASIVRAVDRLIELARDLAANRLEAHAADLVFSRGVFSVVGTDIRCSLAELAAEVEAEARPDGTVASLSAVAEFQPARVTFPNGCHVCECEIDPETGETTILRYVAVEDIGRVLNPVLVEGQIHGGVAQGLAQAMFEEVRYDSGSGQLITGSFMDYSMPRASDIPELVTESREILTTTNPLGAKGVGEAGTVGSLAVVTNAICDALAPLGIIHVDMPATPARIWAAIVATRKSKKEPGPQ